MQGPWGLHADDGERVLWRQLMTLKYKEHRVPLPQLVPCILHLVLAALPLEGHCCSGVSVGHLFCDPARYWVGYSKGDILAAKI